MFNYFHAFGLAYRILTILEQLTQKIESFDSQLQTLTLSRSNSETCDADLDTVNYQQGSDQPASDEQSNQDYLKSLDTMKVCIIKKKFNVQFVELAVYS